MAIVAYCCYLSFIDRTIQASEATTVIAIADQFGISPAKTVWIGRKVRRGNLKIKRPRSSAARKLLFFLSLWLAGTDFEMDAREEKALKNLARKLKLPSGTAAKQIAKFKHNRPAHPKNQTTGLAPQAQASLRDTPDSAATFSQINQTVSQTFVNTKWEAELFQTTNQANSDPIAELEFTPLETESPVLELAFFDTATTISGKLTISIGNRFIGGIKTNPNESEYLATLNPATDWGKIIAGSMVTVSLDGQKILTGEFQLD